MSMSESELVIADARSAVNGITTLRADLEGTVGADRFTGTLSLKRPNLARIEILGSEGLGRFDVISNGSDLFVYFPDENQFSRMPPGPDGRHISAFVVEQVQHFFDPSTLFRLEPDASVVLEQRTLEDNAGHRVLRVINARTGRAVRYFISPIDGLVHRVSYGSSATTAAEDFVQLKNVRTAEDVPDTAFAWAPPKGATTLQMPMSLDLSGGRGLTP